MKTIIQSPATSAGIDSVESARTQAKSIVKSNVQYIAVAIAFVGGVIMCNAPETDVVQPMIGCGLILVAAAIVIKSRKGGNQ